MEFVHIFENMRWRMLKRPYFAILTPTTRVMVLVGKGLSEGKKGGSNAIVFRVIAPFTEDKEEITIFVTTHQRVATNYSSKILLLRGYPKKIPARKW